MFTKKRKSDDICQSDEDRIESDSVEFIKSEETLAKKKRKASVVDNFNLLEILQNHPLGVAIIDIYKYKQELCTLAQSYLCDIIALHFLQFKDLSISNDEFMVLRDKIIELFPLECPETYFIPPVKKKDSRKGKSERSKGKLVDKYRNRRTFIREAQLLSKSIVVEEPKLNIATVDAEKSKKWLLLNRDVSEVIKHWKASYCLRQLDAQKEEYKDLSLIYENWPILRDPKSYNLIEDDFMRKCPISFEHFALKWKIIFDIFIKLNKKKLTGEETLMVKSLCGQDGDNAQNDYITYMKLQILTSLLSAKANKICTSVTGKKKTFWRPNKIEVTEGVVIHVKIPEDIENAVDSKRRKMSSMGLILQPFIIIVGPTLLEIQKCYIRVGAVTYELPSLLKAVDILFKIYIAFNLSYATESENFCYFMQWALYEFRRQSDVQIPQIHTICNQIKKRL